MGRGCAHNGKRVSQVSSAITVMVEAVRKVRRQEVYDLGVVILGIVPENSPERDAIKEAIIKRMDELSKDFPILENE